MSATNTYATDGRCHNSQPGTYGHECGRPAVYLGQTKTGFVSGFCSACRHGGYEARDIVQWSLRAAAAPRDIRGV
jgi:hypothetical protein